MEEQLRQENEIELQPTERKKRKWADLLFYAVVALLIAVIGFRLWFFNNYGKVEVSGSSMDMTIADGETLMMRLVKDGKGLNRGDVIVLDVESYQLKDTYGNEVDYLIKRLIAVEGDKVRCADGQIEICYAGTWEYVPLEEPYAYYGGAPGRDKMDYDFNEYVVGKGEIFFLGDNRLNSVDSRYQERGGSHLENALYKATDVYGVVSQWALENRDFLGSLFFL